MRRGIAGDHKVVLLSGGLDSAVCLALYPDAAALHVDYGQPHALTEGARARSLARHYGVELSLARVRLPFEIDMSDLDMVVPGRNLILLSLAASLGQPVIGANADDREVYEDCRREFFDALRPAVDVLAPLLDMTKDEVGREAARLSVPIELTWSCYYPTAAGRPCGQCGACTARSMALAGASR